MSNMDERRAHERHLVSLPVEIINPPVGKVTLLTQDLSLGGAFVKAEAEDCLAVGTVLSVRIPGFLWGEHTSTVVARVVRVTDDGMGLQFLDFSTE